MSICQVKEVAGKRSFTAMRNAQVIGENLQECCDVIPEDSYNAAYCIFYLLGCGTFLPWNFFITANDYFRFKLREEEELQQKFQNYFSVVSMVPSLVMMIINVFALHRYSRRPRICISLALMIFLFVTTSSLVLIQTDKWAHTFFIITLVKMVVINVCVAVLQGALCGMVTMFPTMYIRAMLAGQSLGGLFAASANILSLFGDGDIRTSAFGYFNTATSILILSLIGYLTLERTSISKYYTKNRSVCFCSCKCGQNTTCHRYNDFISEGDIGPNNTNEAVKYMEIFKKLVPMALSTYMVFFVTLSVFPSTIARIRSVVIKKNDWTEKFYVPVTCFLVFNIFDFIGKILSGFVKKPGFKGPWLLILCFSRLAFLPLFVFCNIEARSNKSLTFFTHHVYPVSFTTLFALTNGYLSSLAIMYAPRFVDVREYELTGTIMSFCVVAGLSSGAAFSFVIASSL